jgi:hydroxymethylpyrimidine pyrophosphatase-like HAD family hydrolase
METPKTIFCDIDGTLLRHHGSMVRNVYGKPEVLPGVLDSFEEWNRRNYHIVLTTGRKESTRKRTEEQLASLGIIYDQLVMGLPNGQRVLINDKKTDGTLTVLAINPPRNSGDLCIW